MCPICGGREWTILVERVASQCKGCGHIHVPADGTFFDYAIAMLPLLSEATLDGLATEFRRELRRRQTAKIDRIRKLPFAPQINYSETVGRVALEANAIYIWFGDQPPVEVPCSVSLLLDQLAGEEKEFSSETILITKPEFIRGNRFCSAPQVFIYLKKGDDLSGAELMIVELGELISACHLALK